MQKQQDFVTEASQPRTTQKQKTTPDETRIAARSAEILLLTQRNEMSQITAGIGKPGGDDQACVRVNDRENEENGSN